jgi:membrane-associated phospholipid phosphatase
VPWYALYVARLMHLWYAKALGTSAFMATFFYGYFAALNSPVHPVTVMPTTQFDEWVAFWPPAFYLYASLWVYTSLVPALQPNLLRLVAYGCAIGALCLAGLGMFVFFPTAVPYVSSSWTADPTLSLLHSLDAPGNAFPSLHVATAIFTALCLQKLLRELPSPAWLKLLNWLWCVLIVYSTLAIKQHVIWDAVAGTVLALVFGWLYTQLEKRLDER